MAHKCFGLNRFLDRKKPAASATLVSIGRLGVEENKKHAAALFPVIKKHLNVDGNRCYIQFQVSVQPGSSPSPDRWLIPYPFGFQDVRTSDLGYGGKTFHDLLG